MESGTLELLRLLQSGPYDESGWKSIRSLLRGQRRYLRAQQDLSTLSDLVQLLESWSQACDDPRYCADALREAADISERELRREDAAAELRKRALSISHGTADRTRPERPIARERAGNPQALVAAPSGGERGDIDGAIEAFERALSVEADMDIVYKLAELYAKRGAPGDAQQAADLYCTLGDVLGNPAGMPMLQRALEQVPDHVEARSLFQQYGGSSAIAPVAAKSVRPRRITRPQTSRAIEPPSPSAKEPRIAAHRTAAGLGPPAAAGSAAAPILQPGAAARTLLKPGAGLSPRTRRSRTPGGGMLVAPQPHGPIASGALAAEPRPRPAANPAIEPGAQFDPPDAAQLDEAWNDEANASAAAGEPVTATAPATGKGPPPLKTAKERARELQPIAQGTPVITIVQPPQPSARPAMPATSLSPIVVDDERAFERARERLEKARTRRRKVLAVTVASTAVAALAVIVFAPRSMEDAQRMATGLFGRDDTETTTTTSTASQPPPPSEPKAEPATPVPSEPAPAAVEPSQPSAAEPSKPTPGEPSGAIAAEQAATAAAPEAAAPADARAAQEPAPPSGPSVLAQLEQATLRGGKLTEAQLSAALEKAGPKLMRCYADALEKKPRLKGRLVLAWTVKPNGRVAGAKKSGGTIKDAHLTRCSIGAIASTRFPKPKKQAAQVKLPFDYKR